MNQAEVLNRIKQERKRQDMLHPNNNIESYLEILIEEVGEVATAMQQKDEANLKVELIQVAAVACRWLESL
jgi:NTP pyrophosphatase (non-canonical NTP hydrolase)